MKRSMYLLVSLVVLASMLLAACGSATATVAPATSVPATAAAVTAAPATAVPVATEPIPFPDGGKSVTGAWSQEPDSIAPYWTQMSYADWITQLTLAGLGEWDD